MLPPHVTQQRALGCAFECVQLEHKEAGISLHLKAAIACGPVFVADVGKGSRWELFVGGPALHALGHAAHDVPVGGVVVAKETWATAQSFATGTVLASGNVLLSSLLVPITTDSALVTEWQRMYDEAQNRRDVNAAIAPYVPMSARLRLSELTASHLDEYRERTSFYLFCLFFFFNIGNPN